MRLRVVKDDIVLSIYVLFEKVNRYQLVIDMSYSYFAQCITFNVSLNLASAELHPKITTNPS